MKLRNHYNEAGLPSQQELDQGGSGYATVIDDLRYDARGKPVRQTLGNGVVSERQWDSETERLTRIYTWLPGSPKVEFQDLNYDYDPVGNPLQITDDLTTSTYKSNRIIPNTRTFEYDPRYRLINATGKKHATVTRYDEPDVPSPDPGDYDPYDYDYNYDEVGNLTKNDEFGGGTLQYKATRLDLFNGDSTEATNSDPTLGNYRYDENGNTLHTTRLSELAYTHDNQVRYVDKGGGTEIRDFRHGDQRTVRMVNKTGVRTLGIYLGPFEYHYREGTTNYSKTVLRTESFQAERVIAGSDPDSLEIFYVHGDHLGSGHVLTDESGVLLSQEEYFPYGKASDRRDTRNRYRYIGVERDEETGLCMTGPRTYDPYVGRFLQGDPLAAKFAGKTGFGYASGNPVGRRDVNGYEDPPVQPEASTPPPSTVDFTEAEGTTVKPEPGFFSRMFGKLGSLYVGARESVVNFFTGGGKKEVEFGHTLQQADMGRVRGKDDQFAGIDPEDLSMTDMTRDQDLREGAERTNELGRGVFDLAAMVVTDRAAGVLLEGAGSTIATGKWGAGSFDSAADSLAAHFAKHGAEVGATDVTQYLMKAQEFARNLRRARSSPVEGFTEGVIRYVKNGRYIDLAPDGTIISFGAQ